MQRSCGISNHPLITLLPKHKNIWKTGGKEIKLMKVNTIKLV
jgi:hypothetical protein